MTSAVAVCWFDMPSFWANSAQILKPGRTVAQWTCANFYCHPFESPNAIKVQAILADLKVNILGLYEVYGNRLLRNMYRDLPLPCTVSPPG
jgi:trans-aconitate 3-methyltransferase